MIAVRSGKPLNMRLYTTVSKATEEYPVSRRTLWNWIADGSVQIVRLKRGQKNRVYILISSLQKKFVPVQ